MSLVGTNLVRDSDAVAVPVITASDQTTWANQTISCDTLPGATYQWVVYDPEGVDASSILSAATSASTVVAFSTWTGRIGGPWTLTVDRNGVVATAVINIGVNMMVYETISFGGTLDVSGSTVSTGGYDFDLNASGLGDLTSDANQINMVVPNNHNASVRLSIPLSELNVDDATSFTFGFILDPPTFPTSGGSSSNFWHVHVGVGEADSSPYFRLGLVFDSTSSVPGPSQKGVRIIQGTGSLVIKTNSVNIDDVRGLAMRIYGGIPGESSPNGNRFARCFYTTNADATLTEAMTGWTEYGSGDLVGLRDVNDANIGALDLEFLASNGSASTGYTVSWSKLMLLRDV